jgi:hypothetical protein
MRKIHLFIIIIALCFMTIAAAPLQVKHLRIIASENTTGGGCTKGATIYSDNFEAISDSEEWSNDGNWIEESAVSDVVGDDAVYHNGSLSGLVGNATNGSFVYKAFTEITSGKTTWDFYIYGDDVTGTTVNLFRARDDTYIIVLLQIDSSGNLEVRDDDVYVDIGALSVDTWYHVEVELDTDITTGIDAINVWVDGTIAAAGPFDTYGQNNPSGVDRAGYVTDTGAHYWVDDYLHYTGVRCAE